MHVMLLYRKCSIWHVRKVGKQAYSYKMAATVNVLCPNGRRQNVKVSPNTRILEIIETVCQKQKFNPDDYDLKHHRTILDVQVPFRYANLLNNSKLELVKAERPRSQSAATVIALQLQSGERLQHSFESSASLWDLLQHWEGQENRPSLTCPASGSNETLHPVCIYMRQEIIGEVWLKATTLKGLGLSGGKAIIRLLHRAVELPPPPPTPTQPKQKTVLNTSTVSSASATPPDAMVSPLTPASTAKPGQSTDGNRGVSSTVAETTPSTRTVPPASTPLSQPVAPVPSSSSETAMDCSTTEIKEESPVDMDDVSLKSEKGVVDSQMSENQSGAINRSDDNDKSEKRTVRPKEKRLENSEPSSSVASTSTGEGGKPETGKAKDVIKSIEHSTGWSLDEYAKRRIQNLLEKEEEMIQGMQTALLESAAEQRRIEHAQQLMSRQTAPYANFKFPEQVSRSNTKDGSRGMSQSNEPVKPCDRNQLVFSTEQESLMREAGDDVPEEFFNVTVDDVRKMLSDLRHQSADVDKSMETRAMREAREVMYMRKYEKVVMRIHFPGRIILQGFFRPRETVEAVKEFVKSNLAEKEQQFYLYTTPPKVIIQDMKQTLFKAKLFPAAVVYFGSSTSKDQYLHKDVLGNLASFLQAESVVAQNMNTGSAIDAVVNSSQASTLAGASGSSSAGANSSGGHGSMASQQTKRQASPSSSAMGSGKVPKWFKVGRK